MKLQLRKIPQLSVTEKPGKEIPTKKAWSNRPCLFYIKNVVTGVRAHPNQKWSTAKTAGKTVFPGVFPRFGVGDFPFGGLGGVQPPSRAPRLGSSGAFFCRFLRAQKAAPSGQREPSGKPPTKKPGLSAGHFFGSNQLNMTTSSLGFSPGSTLMAVSTGPVESGVWPW